MQINIRQATENDLEVVQELNKQLFANDKQFDSTLNMKWPGSLAASEYFIERFKSENGIGLVASTDGLDVGYLVGGVVPSYSYRTVQVVAELENMYVLEEFRSQGVGAALAGEFLNWCRNKQIDRVKVELSAGNDKAHRFYKELGFHDYVIQLEGIVDKMGK